MRSRCRWSDEQERIISELYLTLGPKKLAERMGVSASSLKAKAIRMGLRFQPRKIRKVKRREGENERRYLRRVILANVEKGGEACWVWQGGKIPQGYGSLFVNGKQTGTHRLAYELFVGPIPKGKFVCHSCDNPPCCNPDHLFLGTNVENTKDRHEKGRTAAGERNGNSVLSDDQVREVKEKYDGQYGSITKLAKEYGVCFDTMRKVLKEENWKSVSIDALAVYEHTAKRPPRSDEVRERIRAALKGRKRPQEVIDKIRRSRWGT